MSKSAPEFFATPGYGDTMLANMHYHQAVRVGDRVEISGQGGWDDDITFPESLEDEIVRAFDNVERTLATAGATCTWATARPSGPRSGSRPSAHRGCGSRSG